MPISNPHGQKIQALLANAKIPDTDLPQIESLNKMYDKWKSDILGLTGTSSQILKKAVALLNEYRNFIDINLAYDSTENFLYRQKGQLKLDNSVIEEFLPLLASKYFKNNITDPTLFLGPSTCFSSVRFDSSAINQSKLPGMSIKEKDQDFTLSRQVFLRSSHSEDFSNSDTQKSSIAYLAAECKTNLDKTMFQEAASTAFDLKTASPASKYLLLCEWLDMVPISSASTAIDEIIILRKAKRMPASLRQNFNDSKGRKKFRSAFVDYIQSNPFSEDSFERVMSHLNTILSNASEDEVLRRGYF
jgi:hypothetical protein